MANWRVLDTLMYRTTMYLIRSRPQHKQSTPLMTQALKRIIAVVSFSKVSNVPYGKSYQMSTIYSRAVDRIHDLVRPLFE